MGDPVCFPCARRRYVLTGTPAANYPRDVVALMVFTSQKMGVPKVLLRQRYLKRRCIFAPAIVNF
jgi:hypothetical protein